jgi:hypothetical protein
VTQTDGLLAPLNISGVTASPVGLAINDPSLPFEDFEMIFRRAAALGDAARWLLGDILLFGRGKYGEAYAQLLGDGTISERQLNRYRYVCERVARSRRRKNLSFSHHEEVAPLEPAQQERLLARAAQERLSIADLREDVRDLRAVAGPPSRQTVLPAVGAQSAVDAARGLGEARRTLERVSDVIDSDEGREAAGIPSALRGIDEASKAVRHLGRVLPLRDAAVRLRDAAQKQTGLADPAYIVPAVPFEAFLAALEEAE